MRWVGIAWGTGSNTSEYQSASKLARLQIWRGNCARNRCHVHQIRVMTQYDSVLDEHWNKGSHGCLDNETKLTGSKNSSRNQQVCNKSLSWSRLKPNQPAPRDASWGRCSKQPKKISIWGLLGISYMRMPWLLSRVGWHCEVSHLSTCVIQHYQLKFS